MINVGLCFIVEPMLHAGFRTTPFSDIGEFRYSPMPSKPRFQVMFSDQLRAPFSLISGNEVPVWAG
jgi:hypothetical protein